MSNRSDEEVVEQIKKLIETQVKPAVANHGGVIEFVSYDEGDLLLELGGACSGCAGSMMTLKMGVENMLKHFVPEINTVEAIDDPYSTVAPFYSDDHGRAHWDTIPVVDDRDNNDSNY